MSSNEIINNDSLRMAQAAANHDEQGCVRIAQSIWNQHRNDADEGSAYWNGVREGANHIVQAAYNSPEKNSAIMDSLRNMLGGEGSSGLANAEIKSDGTIVFRKSLIDETIHPNETAQRQQNGQR